MLHFVHLSYCGILSVDIRSVDIFSVDIISCGILSVDILSRIHIFYLDVNIRCGINTTFPVRRDMILTLPHIKTPFDTPVQQSTFENPVTKGETAENEPFLLLPQCF